MLTNKVKTKRLVVMIKEGCLSHVMIFWMCGCRWAIKEIMGCLGMYVKRKACLLGVLALEMGCSTLKKRISAQPQATTSESANQRINETANQRISESTNQRNSAQPQATTSVASNQRIYESTKQRNSETAHSRRLQRA